MIFNEKRSKRIWVWMRWKRLSYLDLVVILVLSAFIRAIVETVVN